MHLRPFHRSLVLVRGLSSAILGAAASAFLFLGSGALASHPKAPVALSQRNSDLTALCSACIAAEGPEVELTASSDTATCGAVGYRLELEVQPTSVAFTNTPTHATPAIVKPACAQVRYPWTKITGLSPQLAYKWQARERSATAGPWVPFNAGATGFITGLPPANALAFASGSQTLGAGKCSGATLVQHHVMGVPANVPSDRVIALWSSSGTTTFYTEPFCVTPVGGSTMPAVTMGAGTSGVTFYWKSTTSGPLTLVADTAGAAWADQSQTVNPGPPARLAIIDGNVSLIPGVCSSPKVVQSQDVSGNPAPPIGSPFVVTLSSSSPSSAFYSDGACSAQVSSITIPAARPPRPSTGMTRCRDPGRSPPAPPGSRLDFRTIRSAPCW